MTLKTISEKAKSFTFTYSFADYQTAQTAGHALMGYMLGTYKGKGQLVANYAEDKSLSEAFKRICDGFEDYYKNSKNKLERVNN